jgi:outer membrane protein assembly factor BamB
VLAVLATTYGALAGRPRKAFVPLLDYRSRQRPDSLSTGLGGQVKVQVLQRSSKLRRPGPTESQASQPWTQFRGASGQGHAGKSPLPLKWSETENISWKVELPGCGWSSPVIQGDQIWLTTALEPPLGLRALCLDRNTGELVHDVPIFNPSAPARLHPKNSQATPTPIIEDDRVYVHFGPFGTACLSTAGEVLWRAEQGYAASYGPSDSPVLYRDLLLVQCDGSDVRYTVALDKHTGKIRWEYAREGRNSEATPLLIETAGGPQLISSLAGRVVASDPITGKELWRASHGDNYAQVPRPVHGLGLVFTCGGFDEPVVTAVRVDGRGDVSRTHVAWKLRHASVAQIASPLLVGHELYMVGNSGIVTCLDASTGKLHFRERLSGDFSASPIDAGGRIYLVNEDARTVVLAAGSKFRRLADNQLEGVVRASPAVYDQALYLRTDRCLYRIEEE